jgi:chemotaxis-related protein WspB
MKVLVFHIGRDRYGLRLGDIARVLPFLQLKRLPLAPEHVAGLMDFHGRPVPVIDLSCLAGHGAAQDYFDTRIVLIDYTLPGGGTELLGLLAEHVSGIQDVTADALSPSGVTAAPFLGRVASDAEGLIQLVEPAQLLPDSLRAILFQAPSPDAVAMEARSAGLRDGAP